MAYRKKNYRRYRRSYKRSANTSSLSNAINMAHKAFKLASFVASVINPEVKTKDVVVAPGGYGKSPTITQLSNIAEGDGPHDRNGTSIKTKDILIKGSWFIPNGSEATYHVCQTRVLVVVDTQNTGTAPTAADIFDTSASDYMNAPRQTDTQIGSRFKHLADITQTLSVGGNQLRQFKIYRKLGHHIHYSGANGTDELAGNIWIVYFSSQDTNSPTFECTSRLSYYDN